MARKGCFVKNIYRVNNSIPLSRCGCVWQMSVLYGGYRLYIAHAKYSVFFDVGLGYGNNRVHHLLLSAYWRMLLYEQHV